MTGQTLSDADLWDAPPAAPPRLGAAPPADFNLIQDPAERARLAALPEITVDSPRSLTAPQPPASAQGLSDADLWDPPAPTPGAQGELKPNDTLGFATGALKPIQNLDSWAASAGVPDWVRRTGAEALGLGGALQQARGLTQASAEAAAQGQRPGKLGNFFGSMVGTAPLLAIPGLGEAGLAGQVGVGLASGALESDHKDLGGIAMDAGLGGATAGVLGGLVGGIGGIVAPRINQASQLMHDIGVPQTVGGLFGNKGLVGRGEQLMNNYPGVGEMVRKRGNEALVGFNRALANEALAPVGGVPGAATANSGHELYEATKTAMDAAYAKVGGGAPIHFTDSALRSDMAGVQANVNLLPEDLKRKFASVIGREIGTRFDPSVGGLTTAGIKDAKAALNKEINKVKNPSLFEGDYVDALKQTRNALTSALGRTSPQAAADLKAADAAYPAFKAYQKGVANSTQNMTTPAGWMTPQQAQSALNAGASLDSRAAASSRMNKIVEAGKEVLPRRYKDVVSPMQSLIEAGVGAGVVGTDVMGGHHAGALMAGPLLTMPLYSKLIQDVLRGAVVSRPGWAPAVRGYIGGAARLTAPAQALAPKLLPQYPQASK